MIGFRFIKVQPTTYLLEYRGGKIVREGLGLSCFYYAPTTSRALGNGSLVTAPDTVPFCIWMAAHHLDRFVDALGKTVSVGGDCDTNAAIVCGVVALSAGRDSIPVEWLKAREPIHI